MASDTFPSVMIHVFAHEGGYVDHIADPGGATHYGITIATLQDWRGKPVTKDDVKALTRAEAMEIYRANYWGGICGDDLPAGVDYAVLDFAVNSGPGRAARMLQKHVGTTQDGEIGPVTVAAAAKFDAVSLINRYCDERLAFLKGLSTWGTFGKGWERRVKEVRTVALQIAQEAVEPPAPVPAPLTLEDRVAALETRVGALEG